MEFNPPSSITHDEWLDAVRPLFALLGTTPEAVYVEGARLVPDVIDDPCVEFVSAVDPENGTKPIKVGTDPYAELGWLIHVAVA